MYAISCRGVIPAISRPICSRIVRIISTASKALLLFNQHLQRRPDLQFRITELEVNGIVCSNPAELHDVLEVPAYRYIHAADHCTEPEHDALRDRSRSRHPVRTTAKARSPVPSDAQVQWESSACAHRGEPARHLWPARPPRSRHRPAAAGAACGSQSQTRPSPRQYRALPHR
jgi:hypothetical protein